jgi:hypothetical protein
MATLIVAGQIVVTPSSAPAERLSLPTMWLSIW